MIELTGRRLGLDSALAADYESFHSGAALVDLSDRGRMRFTGTGAKTALNGILTCDLAPLTSGQGAFGIALTAKGKVVADVTVFAHDDSMLVECSVPTWLAWQALVAKYINPRLAPRQDESASTGALGLFGPSAAGIASSVTTANDAMLGALPMYSHVTAAAGDHVVTVARIADMGVDGYRISGQRPALDAITAAAVAAGARPVGPVAVESARIEAGRPLWGVDMDDSTIPQEANLDALGAISYTKGCYTGQEVVARLHFRGHVNRRLIGLRVEGATAPERGAVVTSAEGKESGDVRSAVVSPRFGPIALGMVRREVEAGASVTVRIDGNEVPAVVSPLPLGG